MLARHGVFTAVGNMALEARAELVVKAIPPLDADWAKWAKCRAGRRNAAPVTAAVADIARLVGLCGCKARW